MSADTPAPPGADTLAIRVQMLERIRDDLADLHADAEARGLPSAVTMGLAWLRDDAEETLTDMRAMVARGH